AVFDQFGNLFLSYVSADLTAVVVVLSKDGGKSFTPLTRFPTSGEARDPDAEGASVDQPKIVVGPGSQPGKGSVWITYADIAGRGVWVAGAEVDGVGQVGPFALRDVSGGHLGNFGDIAVGPDGRVAALWYNLETGDPSTLGPFPYGTLLVSPNPR